MSARKSKLDEYRLHNPDFIGLKWQDKRNGEPYVYERYFASAWDLKLFLCDTFGKRTMRRVFSENVNMLP